MSDFLDSLPDYGQPQKAQPQSGGASLLDSLPDYTGGATPSYMQQQPSVLSKAVEPITSYPQTYQQMNQSARDQMARGVGQISEGVKYAASPAGATDSSGSAGLVPIAKGIGNTAMGAVDYLMSPVNAALHTVVGKPIEEATGIPHQYSEFAASLALPGVGLTKAVTAPETVANAAKVIPSTEQIANAAGKGYDAIRDSKVIIDPSHAGALADRIEGALKAEGYRPVTNTPGAGVFSIIDELRNPQSGHTLLGSDLKLSQASTPADIEAVRKALNVAGADPQARGAVAIAKNAIDDFYKTLPDSGAVVSGDASNLAGTAEQARANTAALKKSQTVTGVEEAADLRTAATNSGKNYDNAVRQRFATILSNPKLRRGFSPDELDQMENIVRGNIVGNTARRIGNVLGGGGGLGQAVATGIGAEAAGPMGAAGVSLLGSALKGIENASQARNVAKLDEMIRASAPAQVDAATAARVKFAADKWARAQSMAERSPVSVMALSKLEAASRGLAVALQRNLGVDAKEVFSRLGQLSPNAQPRSEQDR